jgi:hypothetical protein
MLRLALEHKGLVNHANPHYDPPRSSDSHQEGKLEPTGEGSRSVIDSAAEAEGVFL